MKELHLLEIFQDLHYVGIVQRQIGQGVDLVSHFQSMVDDQFKKEGDLVAAGKDFDYAYYNIRLNVPVCLPETPPKAREVIRKRVITMKSLCSYTNRPKPWG